VVGYGIGPLFLAPITEIPRSVVIYLTSSPSLYSVSSKSQLL
jgi:hypothetical protein